MTLFDIDNFKVINDTYGHIIGDKVLKLVSGIFNQSLRTSDISENWTSRDLWQAQMRNEHLKQYMVATEGCVEQFILNEKTHIS